MSDFTKEVREKLDTTVRFYTWDSLAADLACACNKLDCRDEEIVDLKAEEELKDVAYIQLHSVLRDMQKETAALRAENNKQKAFIKGTE